MKYTHVIMKLVNGTKAIDVSIDSQDWIYVDLSEDNIDGLADKANAMYSMDTSEAYFGYKQAIKDILNNTK